MTVEVVEEWVIHDRWWTDEPLRREFAEVKWDGRRVVFRHEPAVDPVWRIVRDVHAESV